MKSIQVIFIYLFSLRSLYRIKRIVEHFFKNFFILRIPFYDNTKLINSCHWAIDKWEKLWFYTFEFFHYYSFLTNLWIFASEELLTRDDDTSFKTKFMLYCLKRWHLLSHWRLGCRIWLGVWQQKDCQTGFCADVENSQIGCLRYWFAWSIRNTNEWFLQVSEL